MRRAVEASPRAAVQLAENHCALGRRETVAAQQVRQEALRGATVQECGNRYVAAVGLWAKQGGLFRRQGFVVEGCPLGHPLAHGREGFADAGIEAFEQR